MEVASKPDRKGHADYTSRTGQLEGDDELNEESNFLDRCNTVTALYNSVKVDECDLQLSQVVSGVLCIKTMMQLLADTFQDVNTSIDDFNRRASHAKKAVRDMCQNKLFGLAESNKPFFTACGLNDFQVCG